MMANLKRGNKVMGNKTKKKETKLRGENGGERENAVIFSKSNDLQENERYRGWT